MGIPVISNTGLGDVSDLILKYKSGILIDFFKEHSYRNAIVDLSISNFQKQDIRAAALSYYNLQNGIELYNKVYSEMFSLNNRRF